MCTLESGKSHQTTVWCGIVTPFLNRFYHIYFNNYFTSPKLACDQFDCKTSSCVTLHATRTGIPAIARKINIAVKPDQTWKDTTGTNDSIYWPEYDHGDCCNAWAAPILEFIWFWWWVWLLKLKFYWVIYDKYIDYNSYWQMNLY